MPLPVSPTFRDGDVSCLMSDAEGSSEGRASVKEFKQGVPVSIDDVKALQTRVHSSTFPWIGWELHFFRFLGGPGPCPTKRFVTTCDVQTSRHQLAKFGRHQAVGTATDVSIRFQVNALCCFRPIFGDGRLNVCCWIARTQIPAYRVQIIPARPGSGAPTGSIRPHIILSYSTLTDNEFENETQSLTTLIFIGWRC